MVKSEYVTTVSWITVAVDHCYIIVGSYTDVDEAMEQLNVFFKVTTPMEHTSDLEFTPIFSSQLFLEPCIHTFQFGGKLQVKFKKKKISSVQYQQVHSH